MSKKVFLTLALITGLPFLSWFVDNQSTTLGGIAKANPSSNLSVPSKEATSIELVTLERGWVKNEGQWDQRALFSAPGYFGTTWVTKDGELLHVAVKKEECKDKTAKIKSCPAKSWVISERWIDGKVQAIKGEEELGTKVSYFIGNDPSKYKSGLSVYRYVSLGEVWPGVEVRLKATQKTVERLFYVKPGADLSEIQVQLNGAKGLKLSKDGEIIIQTDLGDLKLSKPVAWQEKDGKKFPVKVSYKLIDKNRYSFVVAKADPSLPIVIDPILQSTYLGGAYDDKAYAITIHPTTGDVYVAGVTTSADFPKTIGEHVGGSDAFVSRLNSSLTQIYQSTYLGGSYSDAASAIAINPTTGDVYVTGTTASDNFSKTTGGAQSKGYGPGNIDAFVSRLNSDLTEILQSTYLGGTWNEEAYAIAIHPTTGDVYVAGYTISVDFPRTKGGVQSSIDLSTRAAFVSRLNSDLTQILQSTYLGGASNDGVYAIAIHPATGDVYVAGNTNSGNFPKTTGGAQKIMKGDHDVFVSRLNSSLTQIYQSTYLGGSYSDDASAIAINPTTGDVYVTGTTNSNDFPKVTGGAQKYCNKCGYNNTDAFVARLSSDLTKIFQSTYLGGSNSDVARAIAINPQTNDVYVVGYTSSTDFPKTFGGAQNKGYGGGEHDGFVAKLTAGLAAGSDSNKKTKQNPSNLTTMMGTSPAPAQTQAAPAQTQAVQQVIPATAPPIVQKILSLPPEAIPGLPIAQIQAIPPEYIKFLTIEQIRALTPEQVKALTPEQIKALTPEQVKALSSQTQAAPAQTQAAQQAIQALPSLIQTIKAIKQTIESLSR